jgi:hypothetical protein
MRRALLLLLFIASSAVAQTSPPLSLPITVNPFTFGAVCDGNVHPLSGYYGSLGAAQAVYPFITSLTQQIDYAGLKQMSNTALGADGAEHGNTHAYLNIPMYLPSGKCMLGTDTWKISNASGAYIAGAGTTATEIHSNAIVFQTDGLWYSKIRDLSIIRDAVSGTEPALDIDGNVSGTAATITVQGDSFENLIVVGGNNAYAVAVCRQGGSGGQCSSLQWLNLQASLATFAVYYQNGFNALTNQIIGGDMQNYTTNGIYLVDGSIEVFGTSFESTKGYTQIVNNGYDISAQAGGTNDPILVYGSRSESLRFYKGAFSQLADIRGFLHKPAVVQTWIANTSFPLNYIVLGIDTSGSYHAFRVTTAGGPSGALVPTWPTSGTVVDGSITWTMLNYNVVDIAEGNLDLATSYLDPTARFVSGSAPGVSSCGGTSSPSAISTRYKGSVVEGTGGTGCTISFSSLNFQNNPTCIVTNQTSGISFGYSSIPSALTITNSALGSPVTFNWVCGQ